MAYSYITKGRYTAYMQPSGNWGPSTLTDFQRWKAVDDYRVATQKTAKAPWRPPTGYERRYYAYSGCDVAIDAETIYIPSGSSTRMMQTGADSFGDTIYLGRPIYPLKLEDRAVNEALSSLKQQKIHLGVAFGERKETAEFVANTVMDAVELARAVRRRDLKAVKKQLLGRRRKQRRHQETLKEVLDAPSKLVLTNSYALSPLIADTHGALELLNDKDRADPNRYAVRARKTTKEAFYTESELTRDVYMAKCRFVAKHKGFHGCMVRLDYYIENPFLRTLAQLGITNPLQVAWELVPFSFVADWLLPVGSYLDTLDATVGLKWRGGSISQLTKSQISYGVSANPPTSNSALYRINVRQQNITGSGRMVYLNRRTLLNSPSGRLPSFQNPFSSGGRVLNAIALFTQLTK